MNEVGEILDAEYATVESVEALLEHNGKGQVIGSIDNCMKVLLNDPIIKNGICKNEMSGKIELVRNFGWNKPGKILTDVDMYYLFWYMEKNYHIVNNKKVNEAVQIIADQNAYHPIKRFLESLEWDRVPRIDTLPTKYLGADDIPYVHESMHLLLEAMIHRVYVPGAKFDLMFCLVGGQGAGKSSFLRILCMENEWFSDDLKRLDDDKVYQKIQGHWLIEMSEMLATVNAKSIEEVKSFLSKTSDTYRVPYQVHPEDRPRQCVFVGTTNNKLFLPLDRTGNRRFVPIQIYPERAEKHILENEDESREYMKMVWAEAFYLYQKKERHQLKLSKETEKILPEIQAEFMPEDTLQGQVLEWLDTCSETVVCAKMIYDKAVSPDDHNSVPPQWLLNSISQIVNTKAANWEKVSSHRYKNYGTQRSWKKIVDDDGFEKVGEQLSIPFD